MNNNHVIKCRLCDYFSELGDGAAYCAARNINIPAGKEKTRCTDYAVTELRWRCKNYNPWVTTSVGERNDVCIIGKCIRGCDAQRNHPEKCQKFIAK